MSQISTLAYCKVALHAVKFPHSSVHGLLVGRVSSSENGQEIAVTDAFPVFHSIVLAPPLEIALIHVEQWCTENKLKIVGSYFANERKDDESMDIAWAKPLHEKLVANGVSSPIVLRVDNNKLSLNSAHSCLVAYTYDTGKWKQLDTTLTHHDETLSSYTAALQSKLHRELADFETHLEDPSAHDFYNAKLGQKLLSLTA